MFYQIINILSTAASKESPTRLKGPSSLPATDLFTKWIPFHRSLLSLYRVDVIALFFCAREHSSSDAAFECSFEFAAALKIICSRIEGGQRRLSSFFSHFRSLEAVFCATNYAWNTERSTEKFFFLSSPVFFCALLSPVEFSSLFHILTVLISPVADRWSKEAEKPFYNLLLSQMGKAHDRKQRDTKANYRRDFTRLRDGWFFFVLLALCVCTWNKLAIFLAIDDRFVDVVLSTRNVNLICCLWQSEKSQILWEFNRSFTREM